MSSEKRNTEKEAYKIRLLQEMSRHVGKARAIGMGELYERVFEESYGHRINDTRHLRTLISELRVNGVPICSAVDCSGGGYYLASAGSELNGYCDRLINMAIKKLTQVAILKNRALPELLGQLQLDLKPRGGDHASS